MNKIELERIYESAMYYKEQEKKFINRAEEASNDFLTTMQQYRAKSVERVLNYLMQNWKINSEAEIEYLLTHCKNKLLGNIDGLELTLDDGVPFSKQNGSSRREESNG